MTANTFKGRPYSPYADRAFPTEVYFGDTHVHTGLSADAGGSGTTLMPRDAYRLARGEQVISNTGQPVKMRVPFDFYMITDHSDAMGAITDIIAGAPEHHGRPRRPPIPRGLQRRRRDRRQSDVPADRPVRTGETSPALNYQPATRPTSGSGTTSCALPRSSTTPATSPPSSPSNGPHWSRATTCTATSSSATGASAPARCVPTQPPRRSAATTRATSGRGCRTTRT